MRWSSWLLILLGVAFIVIGVWAWTSAPSNGNNAVLVQPMIIGGAILLAAGVALRACGWCGGYCGYDYGCDCSHCEGCKGGDCCGHCECVEGEGPAHEHGEHAHEHGEGGHEGHHH